MRPIILKRMFLVFIFFIHLIACGGADNLASSGGIGGTGVISTGEITAFGSVWVNGDEFDTAEADLYIDDVLIGTGDQTIFNHLSLGQIVRVEGNLDTDNNGVAECVFYESTLTGPIDRIDVVNENNLALQVLGQTVLVDEDAIFKGGNREGLSNGNLVEVSGFIDEAKQIRCSFLYKKADIAPPGTIGRITGIVEELDENTHTFLINDISVNYAQAQMNGFFNGGLRNGVYVTVKGETNGGTGLFKAETVAPFDRLGENNAEKIIIEGIVNKKMAANRFSIEGYTIEVTPGTKYDGGANGDISAGVHIEVNGEFSQGILVCEEVKFRQRFRKE